MIVISIGGSIVSKEKINVEYIKKVSEIIRRASKNYKLGVVIGGGRLAREYIKGAKKLTQNTYILDKIGIAVTRLNAMLFLAELNDIAYPKVPETVDEAIEYLQSNNIVIMGGTEPGHTTDAVAALLAERTNADRLIIATNVDGIYDKDPREFPNAKKLKKLTFNELIKIVMNIEYSPGVNAVIDHLAAMIIARSKIKTYVIYGEDLEELERAIYGKDVRGSVVDG